MSTIRTATRDDIPALAELFDLYRQFYEQAPDAAASKHFITQRFDNEESRILVAEEGSTLLGFCQLYPLFCSIEARPIYSLSDLFVLPAARRKGLGRALLLAAEDLARLHGKARMDLTTARTNARAQALYESLGWVRDEVYFAYSRRVNG